MSDYFTSVGTKETIESKKSFTRDDAKNELLLDYYELQSQKSIEPDLTKIDEMFQQWCFTLFNWFNIVVQGRQSKFRLLESFKKRYLDSGKLANRKITTVRLHGLTPIHVEKFSNAVFGTTQGRSASKEDRIKFMTKVRGSKSHHVFLLHSFEEFYKECREVCEIIFQLCRECPEYCHILMSSDHINGGKILTKLKLPLKLVFYSVPYGESFIHETSHASLMGGPTKSLAMDENFDLASLDDVHQAMQKSCQQVMIYILKFHVKHNDTAKSRQVSLDFGQLFHHCESKFWLRRVTALNGHLGELIDHSIIKREGNSISCLINTTTCKKFLQSIGEQLDAE